MLNPVVGIICEYDPLHLGHKRQFELIRSQLPQARIVCLMSGCFTQRGMPALHAPSVRAGAALEAGADLVLELPCAFAVRDAEHFALGGVDILSRLGFVTHISFGTEDDIDVLRPAAELLEAPTAAFDAALHTALAKGVSFAAAQGEAISHTLGCETGVWQKPNNILALCYLRALIRTKSPLTPLPVHRDGDYHAPSLQSVGWPSATAVRKAFLSGNFNAADSACGWALPRSPVCLPGALDAVLLYKLRIASANELSLLPDCSEGLENRLHDCAALAVSREDLLSLLKTKRYARARLNRLLAHALLDMTQSFLKAHPRPEYVRMLGLNPQSGLTSLFKQSTISIVSKAADGDRASELYQLDIRAYDLWALGAGLPAGLMLRQPVSLRNTP